MLELDDRLLVSSGLRSGRQRAFSTAWPRCSSSRAPFVCRADLSLTVRSCRDVARRYQAGAATLKPCTRAEARVQPPHTVSSGIKPKPPQFCGGAQRCVRARRPHAGCRATACGIDTRPAAPRRVRQARANTHTCTAIVAQHERATKSRLNKRGSGKVSRRRELRPAGWFMQSHLRLGSAPFGQRTVRDAASGHCTPVDRTRKAY